MQSELRAAQLLADMDPTAAHQAELAFLIYNHSYYERVVLPSLSGTAVMPKAVNAHREAAAEAAYRLRRALERGGSLAHPGREQFSRDDAERMVASWRRIAQAP